MTRQRRLALTLTAAAILLPAAVRSDDTPAASVRAPSSGKKLVLVELFTSQG